MDKYELQTLRARLWDAKMHNFKVGGAEGHLAALQALVGRLPGDGSVDHLIELVDQALAGKPVAHPEVKPKVSAPKPATPKAETKPAPKAEPKAEEKVAKPDVKAVSAALPEPSEKMAEEPKPAEDDIDFDSF